jgi:hypothetical protein
MKAIHSLKRNIFASAFAAVLLASPALATLANAADDAIVRAAGSVSYVSGGVGTESLDRLNSLARDFNLKLVFALKSGDFLSDVRVVIIDAKGMTLLDTMSEGPWFLSKLPAGNYQVVATFAGKAEKRQIAVAATKLRTIDFRWGSE